MSVTLLVTGMAVERVKIELKRHSEQVIDRYHEWIANLPDDTATAACTGDLLCQRQYVRHKTGCIGKDLPFDQYADALLRVVR